MKKTNRIVVITGGSSGIGKLLVEQFVKNGDKVYMLSRSNPDNFERHIKTDIANEKSVQEAFTHITAQESSIDILVNNSGVGVAGAMELLESADVRQCLDVNVMGIFYCCKYALPYMQANAKIINISSVIATFPRPFHTIYSASKAAASMMSHGLRMELAPSKIQVTAICPTGIATPFAKNRIIEYKTNERYGDRIKRAHDSVENRSRMSPEVAARQIYKKINKKKLKPQYIIGNGFKVLVFCFKFISLNTVLRLTNKLCGGIK